jgi:trimeric autotransporter adhesin
MAVPNIFGSATSAIPLSQLDQNFATAITLGNTAVYLGNTTTSLGNVTLTNVLISSTNGDATVNGLTVGRGNASVSTNTAVGASALEDNQAGGTKNSAFGSAALANNTTGSSNSAFGQQALALTTTGAANTAVGDDALASNTTASSNTAVGWRALDANTTGGSNTAVGENALGANTTASQNIAVGYQAGYGNTTGLGNTIMGYQAGYTAGAGNNYNTFIGWQAGYAAARTSGNAVNTAIGYAAGSALTNGFYNTFIGPASGNLVTTGSKNTIIGGYNGNQGGLDIRTSDNYIVLSDGDGNPRAWGNGNGHFCFTNSSTIYNVNNTCFDINQNQSDYTLQMINSNASAPYGAFVRFSGSDPNNTTSFIFGGYAGSSYIYRIYSNGTVAARSDARLKKNIELARNGYLEDLNQIEIVKYNWNSAQEGTPKELGWIAQQVETVFPGLVQTDIAEDGTECKSVKLSVFTPMLIKALQELNAKVEAQAAELAALKGTA